MSLPGYGLASSLRLNGAVDGTSRRAALRPVTAEDGAFLLQVYASTRAEELAAMDWDDHAREAFIEMQFHAQDRHYRSHFSGAQFDVIEVNDVAVGRLYVHRAKDEIRILDIALLPEHRGHGIGALLLSGLQAEAAGRGTPLVLHVEQHNRARSLYLRLGFKEKAKADGMHVMMVWSPHDLAQHDVTHQTEDEFSGREPRVTRVN
jgi:GNAT superfamily N-acetyltransferase